MGGMDKAKEFLRSWWAAMAAIGGAAVTALEAYTGFL